MSEKFTKEITISRALSNIKVLDNKIQDRINKSQFAAVKGPTVKVPDTFKPAADFQAVNDLIKERRALKTAIAVSNASTEIEVAGEKLLVIEAIELKQSITYNRLLLQKMQSDYRAANSTKEKINNDVERKLESIINTLYSKDQSSDADAKATADKYRLDNLAEIMKSPDFDIEKEFEKFSNFIANFEADVDLALSDSNAVTKIKI